MAKLVLGRFLDANPDGQVEYRCMYAFAVAMVDRDACRAAEILDKLPDRPAKISFAFWRAKAVAAHLLERREEALAQGCWSGSCPRRQPRNPAPR